MPKRKPNILFLFPDQWRSDCFGYLDKHPVQTPFTDDLMEKSVIFQRGYAAHPTCIPARASLLTGLTANSHDRLGYQDGVPWRYKNTCPEILRNNGYETFCVGKTHFYPQRAKMGFDQIKLYSNQWFTDDRESDYHEWLKEKSNNTVQDTAIEVCSDNSWYTRSWAGPEELHPNVWTTNEACDLIEKRDPTQPFYLQVNYHRPHPPFDPPASFLALYDDIDPVEPVIGDWDNEYAVPMKKDLQVKWGSLDKKRLISLRKAYYAQLSALDYEIGRMVYYLKKKNLFDNTIIVFSSDHGETLGDHNMFGKCTPLEQSISIPYFFRFPASYNIKPGLDTTSLVSHIDFMPTLLDCADIPIPEYCEGKSLLPYCQQDEKDVVREYLHGEHAPAMNRPESWQFIIRKHDKYFWDALSGREWFFDLVKDPNELSNKIDDPSYEKQIGECREMLICELQDREEDGLVANGKLISGKALPSCRKNLHVPCLDYDELTR